jgi:hypothetical protein
MKENQERFQSRSDILPGSQKMTSSLFTGKKIPGEGAVYKRAGNNGQVNVVKQREF